ncbi:hypothetical protein M8C21_031099 [Ambrosia artemisiifolia]|uniref:AIPP2-like SPOC-like domain-containing protein n=1 Tax=Ambrosia artemisiifolia TaxID=4212 RepID=A0AAD5CDT9_AMBAR|nr:hypothetical protein M8C21_031099 [Ambrosia artemisiifolia]
MATTNSMVERCDICGNPGVIEAIVICCECQVAREHLYCMREFMTEAPPWWRCEECQTPSPKTTDDEQKTKLVSTLLQQTTLPDDEQIKKEVSTLQQQSTLAIKGQNKNRNASKSSFKEKWVHKGRTKYLSCDEAAKLSSGSIKSNNSKTEFHSAHIMSKSMTPPRVFQRSTGLKEKATASTCIRTSIKSPQKERSFKPTLQQPVVKQSFSPKEKATSSTCERNIKSPQEGRSLKPNLQQPVVQPSFSPKEKATLTTSERAHIKSPKEERNVKPNLQKPVQQSFSPKEKATASTCESTTIKSPQEEKSLKPNLQQPVVQQSFSPKGKATLPTCEKAHIKSPKEGRNVKINLQQPVVQHTVGPKEKDVLPFQNRGNATQSVMSSRVGGTHLEREMKTSCKNHAADVEACRSGAGNPNITSGSLVSEMHDPYTPALNSYWKGCFYLPNGSQKFNEAFSAHPPSRVHYKVYEIVKKMPESIYFQLVSNHDIRVDIFPADRDDIGLYFFPMFKRRSENDVSIIDFMWRNNLVMKSNVEGLELFVLSSLVLPSHAQEYKGNYFLWGVFRGPKTAMKVADKPPLVAVKREPCYDDDDVPPGFKRICKP